MSWWLCDLRMVVNQNLRCVWPCLPFFFLLFFTGACGGECAVLITACSGDFEDDVCLHMVLNQNTWCAWTVGLCHLFSLLQLLFFIVKNIHPFFPPPPPPPHPNLLIDGRLFKKTAAVTIYAFFMRIHWVELTLCIFCSWNLCSAAVTVYVMKLTWGYSDTLCFLLRKLIWDCSHNLCSVVGGSGGQRGWFGCNATLFSFLWRLPTESAADSSVSVMEIE